MEAPNERMLRCLLSPELDTTQKEIAAGLVEIKVGSNSDCRSHEEGELFFCISGHGHIRIGDEMIELHPDTALWVPGGIQHQTFNDLGNEDMKLLWVLLAPFGGDKAIISRWKTEREK
jgi:mannose-6-phosphate isomerase-like protein (cupin superfamily)